MIIKEDTDLKDYKFSGYGFIIRTSWSGYVDLFCFKDRKTCMNYYNRLQEIINDFENMDDTSYDGPDDYNYMYEDTIQSFYESCRDNAVDYFEEIDWRRNIISYKGQDVYIDNFNDKYYKVINDIAIDI
jgi:hypothetical protein